jgi:hypothetical protein
MTKYRNIIKIDNRFSLLQDFSFLQNKLECSLKQVFSTSLIFPKKFAWAGSEQVIFQFICFHFTAELQYK